MKNYFISRREKIIITTILTTIILCTTVTAVPIFHHSTGNKILNEQNNFEKNKNLIFIKYFEEVLDKYFVDKNPILEEFKKNIEDNSNKLNEILKNSLGDVFHENKFNQISDNNPINILNILNEKENNLGDDPYSGFDSWWDLYKKCLKLWSLGGLLPYEDYDSWYSSTKTISVVLLPIILVIYASMIFNTESPAILWPFLSIWELYLIYFSYTYLLSSNLLVREIDIVVELKDKNTGEPIEDIDIYATNVNATAQKNAGSEFTYLLEPFNTVGTNYYSLSSRDREYKYCQPPPAPGTYLIEIPEGQYSKGRTYQGYEYTTEYNLKDAESYYYVIELEQT